MALAVTASQGPFLFIGGRVSTVVLLVGSQHGERNQLDQRIQKGVSQDFFPTLCGSGHEGVQIKLMFPYRAEVCSLAKGHCTDSF